MATKRDYSGRKSDSVRPDFDGGVSKPPAKRVSKPSKKLDSDDVPSIDNPPAFDLDDTPPFDVGTGSQERHRPTTQPDSSTATMLIPVGVRGEMSDQQRGNQERGASRAVADYSKFEQDLPKIYELLDSASQDGAISAIHRSLVVSMLDLIPLAIDKYRNSPMDFNAYSLAAMITQLRNLITDLQASKDRSVISDRVTRVLIRGAFVLLAQHAAELNSVLKANLSDKVKPEYTKNVSLALDDSLRALSRYMGATYEELSENVGKLLTE